MGEGGVNVQRVNKARTCWVTLGVTGEVEWEDSHLGRKEGGDEDGGFK